MKVRVGGVEFGREEKTNRPLYKVILGEALITQKEYEELMKAIDSEHTVTLVVGK